MEKKFLKFIFYGMFGFSGVLSVCRTGRKKTFMIKVVDSLSEGDKRQKNWPGWKFQFATIGVADVVVDVVVVVAEQSFFSKSVRVTEEVLDGLVKL